MTQMIRVHHTTSLCTAYWASLSGCNFAAPDLVIRGLIVDGEPVPDFRDSSDKSHDYCVNITECFTSIATPQRVDQWSSDASELS
ncbi:uncharacterized protein Bfra_005617 [Botrytis fragariae]|uniref:Uncharacterized protein n=1 Tax=Botrytis fragariae TaxID=1964551 RepID=A0A8H6ARG8_9HELO|nr:uncharacterized protein Bfra_005617 [Botrytis fragariae]KAF5872262.1 hypothetical protein Bfra_005617 [Botrytis fragariae]